MSLSSTLHHLVYQSSATRPFSETELQSLLTQSREWNTDHGLTGVLLYSQGDILQVLEGTYDEVYYIFNRIQQDCRHHDVTKLADGPIRERSFSEWSMGFMAVDPDEYRHLTGYRNPESRDYLATYVGSEDESLHSLLSSFVQHEVIRF